jgi:sulfatase modifying factor 1
MRLPQLLATLLLPLAGAAIADDDDDDGMALIPAGSYTPLFIKDAEPVSVDAFYLDKTPVTNAQFLEFVRAHPEWRRSQVKSLFADAGYLKHWAGDLDLGPDAELLGEAPVTNISWFAARAYLKPLGKRLPTMDEWELAACADETRADATTDSKFHNRILEWYATPNAAKFPAAHSFPEDFHSIRGLHGLVWEWVRDFNNATVTGESRGDTTLERGLFCAGGALNSGDPSNYAAFMRYAFRSSLSGNYAIANLGFRGARSVTKNQTTP